METQRKWGKKKLPDLEHAMTNSPKTMKLSLSCHKTSGKKMLWGGYGRMPLTAHVSPLLHDLTASSPEEHLDGTGGLDFFSL